MTWTSPYFTPAEMACKCGHCGGRSEMHPEFMARATRLRERWGRGISPSSAFRCALHPSEKDKTTVGAHRQGRAMDIPCSGPAAFKLMVLAVELGFTGVGISQRKDKPRFIHLDDAPAAEGQPRPTVWSY
jgi:zinc D-Ala-D-Ala carboxypeptidase